MTHLAETHTVIGVVGKEIANLSAMRAMTGNAAHLPATTFFRGVILSTKRVTFTSGGPDNVFLIPDMAVTGKAKFIYRFQKLRFILTTMRVMTCATHAGLNRTMYKFLFLDLYGHISVTFVTEFGPTLWDRVLRTTLAGVAIAAGIGTCRPMNIFYCQHLLVTDIAGITLFYAAVHLCRCRVHHVTRLTKSLFFWTMQ